MVPRSRRSLLRTGAGAVALGLGGCLGVLASYPPTGLLVVNADDEPRTVTVRITDTEDTALYRTEFTVPADGSLERERVVTTGPIRVFAYVGEPPASVRNEFFDFVGCRQARPVVTVRYGDVDRIGKQDTCRPTESPYG